MLHDLLLSLAGFSGDIIIDDPHMDLANAPLAYTTNDMTSPMETFGTTLGDELGKGQPSGGFRVRDGYPHISEAERELINRIVPLGWFYSRLEAYSRAFDVCGTANAIQRSDIIASMKGVSDGVPEVYRAALAAALQDICEEYLTALTDLEILVSSEPTIPLSRIAQFLPKFTWVLPAVYRMVRTIEEKRLRGCQLLDFFQRANCAVPALTTCIDRILYRLRVILAKQIFAWTIYGELQDGAREFFIQTRNDINMNSEDGILSELGNSSQNNSGGTFEERVLRHLADAKNRTDQQRTTNHRHSTSSFNDTDTTTQLDCFNWTSSYFMVPSMVPDSHISALSASKILFAGKAALLLQLSSRSKHSQKKTNNTTSNVGSNSMINTIFEQSPSLNYFAAGSSTFRDEFIRSPSTSVPSSSLPTTENNLNETNEIIATACFTATEIRQFDLSFQQLLSSSQYFVEGLEQLVDMIAELASDRLWHLLREELGFFEHLQIVRNTLLMGRGEFFQCLLDAIHSHSFHLLTDNAEARYTVATRGDIQHRMSPKRAAAIAQGMLEEYEAEEEAAALGQGVDTDLEAERTQSDSAGLYDALLNNRILPAAASLCGLDYSEMALSVRFRVQSKVKQTVSTFTARERSALRLYGRARFFLPKLKLSALSDEDESDDSSEDDDVANASVLPLGVEMCSLQNHRTGNDTYRFLFDRRSVFRLASWTTPRSAWNSSQVLNSNMDNSPNKESKKNSLGTVRPTVNGAIWWQDEQIIHKGFSQEILWAPQWDPHTVVPLLLPNYHHRLNLENLTRLPPGCSSLASFATCIHSDTRGTSAIGQGSINFGLSNSLIAGVSIHAYQYIPLPPQGINTPIPLTPPEVCYFARLFIAKGSRDLGSSFKLPQDRAAGLSLGIPNQRFAGANPVQGANPTEDEEDGLILAESFLDLGDYFSRGRTYALEVDYTRAVSYASPTPGVRGDLAYSLSVRFSERLSVEELAVLTKNHQHYEAQTWLMQHPLDIRSYVSCPSGQAWVGVVSSSAVFSNDEIRTPYDNPDENSSSPTRRHNERRSIVVTLPSMIRSMSFFSKAPPGTAIPVCSPYTSSRYPETFFALEKESRKWQHWLDIKCEVIMPPVLLVVFDQESMANYERFFSLLMRIRLVGRALEKLWLGKSAQVFSDNTLPTLRHALHHFIANLLYFLQVDVVDAQFSALQTEIRSRAGMAKEDDASTETGTHRGHRSREGVQGVRKAHRHFQAALLRLTQLDEGGSLLPTIDNILTISLRFVAACRLQAQADWQMDLGADEKTSSMSGRGGSGRSKPSRWDGNTADGETANGPPVFVPQNEFFWIREQFLSQLRVLRSALTRGHTSPFLRRLDFNQFFGPSNPTDTGAGAGHSA